MAVHFYSPVQQLELYFHPLGVTADDAMLRAYSTLSGGRPRTTGLAINDRKIQARSASSGIAWFDFSELCGTARSQTDYLEIARRFHTVMLSNVPRMTGEQASEARRFTWLIDVLYDQRVNLIMSAAAPIEDLYRVGPNSQEFSRTVSRVKEMQSQEYLSQQHLG